MKCPRCGEQVKMISGIKCPKCDHVAYSQNLDTDWQQHNGDLGRKRVYGADEQSKPVRIHNPKRRYPLKGDE